jgi:hypothetical protein
VIHKHKKNFGYASMIAQTLLSVQLVFYGSLVISLHKSFGLNVFFLKIELIISFFLGVIFFDQNAGRKDFSTRFLHRPT